MRTAVLAAVGGLVLAGAAVVAAPSDAATAGPSTGRPATDASTPSGARQPHDTRPPDPAANIAMSPSTFTTTCYTATPVGACEATAMKALNNARAAMHLTPYAIPADFYALPPAEQLLVLSNLDRAAYALPQLVGLSPALSASAVTGAQRNADPGFVNPVDGVPIRTGASNWAGGYADPLSAYYGWMYDDGPGSGNLDCTSTNTSGCWGHRHDVLFDTAGGNGFLGAAAVRVSADRSGNSYTQLFESTAPTAVPTYLRRTSDAAGPAPAPTAPSTAITGTYPTTAFTPSSPIRICDTRTSTTVSSCAAGTLTGGTVRTVKVAGIGGIPADATMAAITVTVTDTTAPGYVTVWPHGAARPATSVADWSAGRTVPDLVQVPLSAGAVDVYVSAGSANVVLDVSGWGSSSSTQRYTPLTPARICDTRTAGSCGSGALVAGEARQVPVAGQGGVPASGATAVVLNVTATDTTTPGYLTAYPHGSTRPLASNVNWSAGETRADRVVVQLPANGAVDAYLSDGAADVVVDVVGYYGASGSRFTPVVPRRVCDTRPGPSTNPCNGGAAVDQRPTTDWRLVLPLQCTAGLPTSTTGAALTMTTIGAAGGGYLAAYPDGSAWPGSSDLNHGAGEAVANLAVVALVPDGALDVHEGGSSGAVILDLAGFYVP